MMRFTDYLAPWVLILGIAGALIYGVPGSIIGCVLGTVIGFLIWWRIRRKEDSKEWVRLFCPNCRLITGSVGRGFIGKKTKLTCLGCGTKYEVEITVDHFFGGRRAYEGD